DFWHAVEFSRNGRFLCTHPQQHSLGLSSGLSLFVLAFSTLSESVPLAFQVLRFRAFPFQRFQPYQILSAPFPEWN
ncbi:hypothetical protein AB0D97_36545, partial [Streptomyces roseus]|uniref:hypothetical protein n=1 Tax=Streptomyces roseus TaxID=66430 RepID=UPI00340B8063